MPVAFACLVRAVLQRLGWFAAKGHHGAPETDPVLAILEASMPTGLYLHTSSSRRIDRDAAAVVSRSVKAAVGKHAVSKDAVGKDAVSKGAVGKDAAGKDDVGMDDVGKDTFQRFLTAVADIIAGAGGGRSDLARAMEGDTPTVAALTAIGISIKAGPPFVFAGVDEYRARSFPVLHRAEGRLTKAEKALAELTAPGSATRARIEAQLVRQRTKPGQDPLTAARVVACKALQVAQYQEDLAAHMAAATADPRWALWCAAEAHTKEHRTRWHHVDNEVGLVGNKHGADLESRRDEIVAAVCEREGLDPSTCGVWSNLFWNDDASLGEVDVLVRERQCSTCSKNTRNSASTTSTRGATSAHSSRSMPPDGTANTTSATATHTTASTTGASGATSATDTTIPTKHYSRPCLPPLWPRLYAEPFGLG